MSRPSPATSSGAATVSGAHRRPPARAWTPAQDAGITTVGRSVMVSAAAGSGKTAVLAARCVHLCCDAPPPFRCDLDELLVVTYTRNAAREMRGRIESALHTRRREAMAAEDEAVAAHVERQIDLLSYAEIDTLHGFCARLLRRHPHRVGLDPGFAVLDPDEARLLRGESLRQTLQAAYDEPDSASAAAFGRLVDGWGDGGDAPIAAAVLSIHGLLGSLVDPDSWLEETTSAVQAVAGTTDARGLAGTSLGRALLTDIALEAESLRRQAARAAELAAAEPGLRKYVEYAANLHDWYETLAHHAGGVGDAWGPGDVDAVARHVAGADEAFGRLPTIRGGDSTRKDVSKGLIVQIRDGVKGPTSWLATVGRFSAGDWADTARRVAGPTGVLLGLVRRFGASYADARREQRAVDFADLERLTLALLTPDSDGTPSPVTQSLNRRYRHVLVDEFQDVNGLQETLLCRIGTEHDRGVGGGNLFCVGDVKQSIYGFRLAEPTRFLSRMARMEVADADGGRGMTVLLRDNFRSRPGVLDAVNAVFARLMSQGVGGVDYDDRHALRPAATFPNAGPEGFGTDAGCPAVEIHVLPDVPCPDAGGTGRTSDDAVDVPTAGVGESTNADAGPDAGPDADPDTDPAADLERAEREAIAVAERLHAWMGNRQKPSRRVAESPENLRPMRWSDVAVLLRAMTFTGRRFADTLRRCGVPTHCDAGGGLFDAVEVRDVLALLDVLDNRAQDIPIAAYLRSPLAGLGDAERVMTRARLAFPTDVTPVVPFHEAVRRYAAGDGRVVGSPDLASGDRASLGTALASLDRWRDVASRRPPAELLWLVYQETGYLAYVKGLPDGPQREANLLALQARARQFGTFRRQGLRRFLRYLRDLEAAGEADRPTLAACTQDVVRVMTVHAAKGMEFPVVVLADAGKRHNLRSSHGAIVFERDAGVGLRVIDEQRRVDYESIASAVVRRRVRESALAEELRVLYVAMTRAKEHLLCVGTAKPAVLERTRARWQGHVGPIPSGEVLRAASPLDWLTTAAFAADDPRRLAVTIADPATSHGVPNPLEGSARDGGDRLRRLATLRPLNPAPAPDAPAPDARARAVIDDLSWVDPHRDVVGRLAATDLLGQGSASRPRSRRPGDSSTPDVAAAVRRVLPHLDLSGRCDDSELRLETGRISQRLRHVRRDPTEGLMGPDPLEVPTEVVVKTLHWLLHDTPAGLALRRDGSAVRWDVTFYAPSRARPGPQTDAREGSVVSGDLSARLDRPLLRPTVDAVTLDSNGRLVLIGFGPVGKDWPGDLIPAAGHTTGRAVAAAWEIDVRRRVCRPAFEAS